MPITCRSCGHENKDTMRFCGECGGKLETEQPTTYTCPACGHVNKMAAKFCGECGLPPADAKAQLASVTITLEKSSYEGGDAVIATMAGVTQRMLDDGAFATVLSVGAPHHDSQDWRYPESTGSARIELMAPFEAGNYEVRFFRSGSPDDSTLLSSAAFSTTAEKESPLSIILDKKVCSPNTETIFTVNGVSKKMEHNRAFLGLYRVGADNSSYVTWQSLQAGDNQVSMYLSEETGDFELRLFRIDNGEYNESDIVARAKFSVKGPACPKCGHENPPDPKFCNECGTKMATGKCKECGADNPPDLKFCGTCGGKL
ncbi:MAG: zinc ribbon domain-containing protein [Methanomassiliicoccaceae archaeon]|jgi:hypothetical protein|nr:zinc ribbon domain-containing protein [Methanomassiliicoccaceae archaeon]